MFRPGLTREAQEVRPLLIVHPHPHSFRDIVVLGCNERLIRESVGAPEGPVLVCATLGGQALDILLARIEPPVFHHRSRYDPHVNDPIP